MSIINKQNDVFQVLMALKHNRHKRSELKEVFIEGIAPVKSAAAAGRPVKRIIYRDYAMLSDWAKDFIKSSGQAQAIALSGDLYGLLADKSEPSEIMVTIEPIPRSLTGCSCGDAPFVVVCDRPSNHGNLGSLIRTANAFGVDLVVTTGHAVDIYDPAVIRASLGGVFRTPVCHEESTKKLQDWLDNLKQTCPDLKVVGTDSAAGTCLPAKSVMRRPMVLLLGNEARGLSVSLKQYADTLVGIPMQGQVDSLNVACAGSIFLYEVYRNAV